MRFCQNYFQMYKRDIAQARFEQEDERCPCLVVKNPGSHWIFKLQVSLLEVTMGLAIKNRDEGNLK